MTVAMLERVAVDVDDAGRCDEIDGDFDVDDDGVMLTTAGKVRDGVDVFVVDD